MSISMDSAICGKWRDDLIHTKLVICDKSFMGVNQSSKITGCHREMRSKKMCNRGISVNLISGVIFQIQKARADSKNTCSIYWKHCVMAVIGIMLITHFKIIDRPPK